MNKHMSLSIVCKGMKNERGGPPCIDLIWFVLVPAQDFIPLKLVVEIVNVFLGVSGDKDLFATSC